MILKELKRQFFSVGMLLSLIIGLILLFVGFYPDIKAYAVMGIVLKSDYMSSLINALTSAGFLVFTPIIVVLPGVIQFCDDYNYGYSRFIITRVSKKEFLIKRYVSTIISGGIACMLPLLVFSIFSIIICEAPTEYSRVAYSVIYSQFAPMWEGKAVMAHICLYGFIFGVVWASIGLMFASIIPNRYVALGLPVALFYVANIVCNALELYKYSPVNMILIDIQDSQLFVIFYQLVLLVVSGAVYMLVASRRLKNA